MHIRGNMSHHRGNCCFVSQFYPLMVEELIEFKQYDIIINITPITRKKVQIVKQSFKSAIQHGFAMTSAFFSCGAIVIAHMLLHHNIGHRES